MNGNGVEGNRLALVDTSELLGELFHRFDASIFYGMRIGELGSNTITYYRQWDGNPTVCMGLCDELSFQIAQKSQRSARPLLEQEKEDDEDDTIGT